MLQATEELCSVWGRGYREGWLDMVEVLELTRVLLLLCYMYNKTKYVRTRTYVRTTSSGAVPAVFSQIIVVRSINHNIIVVGVVQQSTSLNNWAVEYTQFCRKEDGHSSSSSHSQPSISQ